jgi:TfoX/Sxy family transcriptional regulator of competence genes
MKWKKAPDSLVSFLADTTKDVDCTPRKMFGYPCYFINGNMFLGAHKENLILRLSQDDKKNALKNPNIHEFTPMGRTMKEYVALREDMYTDEKVFPNLLTVSIKYAESLPPKKKNRKK